jgi:hypothetical protein
MVSEMDDEEQPKGGDLEKLSKHRVQLLEVRGLLDTHDGSTKIGGSRQDIWMDKSTGELWVARKHRSVWYERLYINPRELNVPGF